MNYKKLFCKSLCLGFALVLCACSQGDAPSNMQEQESSTPVLSMAEESATDAFVTPQLGGKIKEKKQENPDTIGWLIVPGTNIDSAIVQNPPDDNGYYLTHDFHRNASKAATYSVDRRCDFTSGLRQDISRNIALYGHSFDENPDGELFSQIKKYKDPEFARTHPYIFFSTADEDMVWEVFAVFNVATGLPYIIPELRWETFSRVMDVVYDASVYDYGITVTEKDNILSVSCCTYHVPGKGELSLDIPNNYRFVVMSRLVSPNEPIKEYADFTRNETPLPPDEMPDIYHEGNDVFMYDGFIYYNVSSYYSYNLLDFSDAVFIGEIKRSGITVDFQDFDAVQIKAGTQIMRHGKEKDVLFAVQNGEMVPYLKWDY